MANNESQAGPSTKRARIEENDPRVALKKKVFTAMVHWYCQCASEINQDYSDLLSQETLISHMFNALKHKRQELNGTGSIERRAEYLDKEITWPSTKNQRGEVVVNVNTMRGMLIKLDQVCAAYQLTLSKGAEWIGMATPILATLSLFKARIEELRMGHTKMPRGGGEVEISQVGLNPAHGILLEGIRWSPHLRSACASACGPLTQVICYRQAARQNIGGNIDYSKKWARVLSESLKHLPTGQDIIKAIPTASEDEFRTFMPIFANVLLMTSSRQNKKVALPMFFFLKKVTNDTLSLLRTPPTSEGRISPITPLEFVQSGKLAIDYYNGVEAVLFPTIHDENVSKQLLFHGIFGSYSDNLEVLKWMTGTSESWATRSQIGKDFANLSTQEKKDITLYKIRYYSKPVSSNQSVFYKNMTQQVSTIPTFSGKTKSDCTMLLQYLEKGNGEMMTSARGLHSLRSILQGHLDKMREHVAREQCMTWGNTDWVDLNEMAENSRTVTAPRFGTRMFMGNYESEIL